MEDLDYYSIYLSVIEESIEFKNFYNRIETSNPCHAILELFKHCTNNNSFSKNINKNRILKKINDYSRKVVANLNTSKDIKLNISNSTTEKLMDIYLEKIEFYHILLLKKIVYRYSLLDTEILMKNQMSILKDDDVLKISPIIFDRKTWQKIIIYELSILDNYNLVSPFITKAKSLLFELSIDVFCIDFNLITLDEDNKWHAEIKNNEDNIPPTFEGFLERKYHFLEFIDYNEIEKVQEKNLKHRLRKVTALKKELESKLKKQKLAFNKSKHYKQVFNGLIFLLRKENPEEHISLIKKVSKKIIQELFYLPNEDEINLELPNKLKINNVVLTEFLIFLLREKKIINNQKKSLATILSNNLSFKLKGFSYQSLYRIQNNAENSKKLTFNNTTSASTLRNKMRD